MVKTLKSTFLFALLLILTVFLKANNVFAATGDGCFNSVCGKNNKALLNQYIDTVISVIIPAGTDDLTKIKLVHDFIVKRTSYDLTYSQHDALDVIASGLSVCSGYSDLFKIFMDRLGIPCKCVSGYANGGYHGWNAVQLNGEWYYVDVTWDDPVVINPGIGDYTGTSNFPGGENLQYKYFMVPYNYIAVDHAFSPVQGTNGTSLDYCVWASTSAYY